MPVQQDLPALDLSGAVDQAKDGKPDNRFAAAAFSDKAHHLACADLEADTIDRFDRSGKGVKMGVQILHSKQRL